jgi:catechol 2,3-dioxygenase-like lactoylglutathione lyase family enzyme
MLHTSNAFSSFAVDNLERAKEFYQKTLGLKVKDNPMGILELELEGGTTVLVYPKPDHVPATFTVLNFPVRELEKTVDLLTERGVRFQQYPELNTDPKGISWGAKQGKEPNIAWFTDPAGNILSVLEP